MSLIFPSAILGLEMTAPILWAPGIFWFFLLENPRCSKNSRSQGGLVFFGRGGVGSSQFYFYGRGDCSENCRGVFLSCPLPGVPFPDLPSLGVLSFLGLFWPRRFLGVSSVFSSFSQLFLAFFAGIERGKRFLGGFLGFSLYTKERKLKVLTFADVWRAPDSVPEDWHPKFANGAAPYRSAKPPTPQKFSAECSERCRPETACSGKCSGKGSTSFGCSKLEPFCETKFG